MESGVTQAKDGELFDLTGRVRRTSKRELGNHRVQWTSETLESLSKDLKRATKDGNSVNLVPWKPLKLHTGRFCPFSLCTSSFGATFSHWSYFETIVYSTPLNSFLLFIKHCWSFYSFFRSLNGTVAPYNVRNDLHSPLFTLDHSPSFII